MNRVHRHVLALGDDHLAGADDDGRVTAADLVRGAGAEQAR
jgi:hypothetical protein